MRPLLPAAIGLLLLLAGCYGSTLDSMYPGGFGHTPPPAANLPPRDCPPPPPNGWNTCDLPPG